MKRIFVVLGVPLGATLAFCVALMLIAHESALGRETSDERFVALDAFGYEFRIPVAYDPELMSSALMLTAKAPTFEPTDGRLVEGNLATMVELRLANRDMLEQWRRRADDRHRIEPLGHSFDLIKERVSRTDGKAPHVQYYAVRADGSVETLIFCVSEKLEFQCEHLFERGGMLYVFHQMPDDIPQWRRLQTRLVSLFESFTVGARKWPTGGETFTPVD